MKRRIALGLIALALAGAAYAGMLGGVGTLMTPSTPGTYVPPPPSEGAFDSNSFDENAFSPDAFDFGS